MSSAVNWARKPSESGIPGNCPPGLEYLLQCDGLIVKQQVELVEVITSFEAANRYQVLNKQGQQVFYVVEDSGCCTRQFCGHNRTCTFRVLDNQQRVVASFVRPFKCTVRCITCWCNCQLQQMEVDASGRAIGYVKQKWDWTKPRYSIRDGTDKEVLEVKGPVCPISCGSDVPFQVLTSTGQIVGDITKKWSGFCQEAFSDADTLAVDFPMDLDVNVKASLLATLFLIDMNFFESKHNRRNI